MTIVWEVVNDYYENVQRHLPLASIVIPASSMLLGPPECPIWIRNFALSNFLLLSVIIFFLVSMNVFLSTVNMFALHDALELLSFYLGYLKTVIA